jgi:hypothetical protein
VVTYRVPGSETGLAEQPGLWSWRPKGSLQHGKFLRCPGGHLEPSGSSRRGEKAFGKKGQGKGGSYLGCAQAAIAGLVMLSPR